MFHVHVYVCVYVSVCIYLWPVDENMGWLRLVGSLELQVSFAEYSLFYRALLQKGPIILRSLLIEATPYLHCLQRQGIMYLQALIYLKYTLSPLSLQMGNHVYIYVWTLIYFQALIYLHLQRYSSISRRSSISNVHYLNCLWRQCPLRDGYDQSAPENYRFLLQNILSFIGLFYKRDQSF